MPDGKLVLVDPFLSAGGAVSVRSVRAAIWADASIVDCGWLLDLEDGHGCSSKIGGILHAAAPVVNFRRILPELPALRSRTPQARLAFHSSPLVRHHPSLLTVFMHHIV